MKREGRRIRWPAALRSWLLLLTCAGGFAHASIVLTFAQPDQSGNPGDTLTFSATLRNTGTDEVFFNDLSVNFSGSAPDFLETGFLDNVPISLDGGTTSDPFNILEILISPTYAGAYGLFSGTVQLTGGAGDQAQDILLDPATPFSVNVNEQVAPAPEPATFALMFLVCPVVLRRWWSFGPPKAMKTRPCGAGILACRRASARRKLRDAVKSRCRAASSGARHANLRN